MCSRESTSSSLYLLIAADAPPDTLQLGVTDLSELVLRHGNYSVVLRDELAAVMNKETVITRKCVQDLQRQEPLQAKDGSLLQYKYRNMM